MLRELYIKNVAIIKEQRLSFDRGFTVLTGETGAGKSIIIESVGLICGARASKESIRSGEEKASVTALFSDIPARTASALSDMGFDCDGGELALSREVTAGGGSASALRENRRKTRFGFPAPRRRNAACEYSRSARKSGAFVRGKSPRLSRRLF